MERCYQSGRHFAKETSAGCPNRHSRMDRLSSRVSSRRVRFLPDSRKPGGNRPRGSVDSLGSCFMRRVRCRNPRSVSTKVSLSFFKLYKLWPSLLHFTGVPLRPSEYDDEPLHDVRRLCEGIQRPERPSLSRPADSLSRLRASAPPLGSFRRGVGHEGKSPERCLRCLAGRKDRRNQRFGRVPVHG